MIVRDRITSAATQELLDSGDNGKPTAEQFDKYFRASGRFSSYASADAHSKKNWCGFFAIFCLHEAGLIGARWDLNPELKWNWGICGPVQVIKGSQGIEVGDVAILNTESHHVIISQVIPGYVMCIEGNGEPPANMQYLGGVITTKQRPVARITAYYRISESEAWF